MYGFTFIRTWVKIVMYGCTDSQFRTFLRISEKKSVHTVSPAVVIARNHIKRIEGLRNLQESQLLLIKKSNLMQISFNVVLNNNLLRDILYHFNKETYCK